MSQLLVRKIDDSLVLKLKKRARGHGVSAEEEHRQILREALLKADDEKPSLIEFLLFEEGAVSPEVELDLIRSTELESRNTGI